MDLAILSAFLPGTQRAPFSLVRIPRRTPKNASQDLPEGSWHHFRWACWTLPSEPTASCRSWHPPYIPPFTGGKEPDMRYYTRCFICRVSKESTPSELCMLAHSGFIALLCWNRISRQPQQCPVIHSVFQVLHSKLHCLASPSGVHNDTKTGRLAHSLTSKTQYGSSMGK